MLKRLLTLVLDALVYGAGSLVGQVLSLLLLPIYTKGGFLAPQDFGILQMLLYIPMVFVLFAAAGMKSAVSSKLFPRCRRVLIGAGPPFQVLTPQSIPRSHYPTFRTGCPRIN